MNTRGIPPYYIRVGIFEYPPIIITSRFGTSPQGRHKKGPRMKTRELCLLILISSILQLVGMALFARGFFPYKKVLAGFATANERQDFLDLGLEPHVGPPEKVFDRLVFIVIDALRRYIHDSIVCCVTLVTSCSPLTLQCLLLTGWLLVSIVSEC